MIKFLNICKEVHLVDLNFKKLNVAIEQGQEFIEAHVNWCHTTKK